MTERYNSEGRVVGTMTSHPADGAISTLASEQGAASKWQPIETAPKDGTWVLTWGCLHNDGAVDMGEAPSVQPSYFDGNFWYSDQWGSHQPTRWQPLPASPLLEERQSTEGSIRSAQRE